MSEYEWPSCCENGCRAPAAHCHVADDWRDLQEGQVPEIDPDPAVYFYCDRHGLSSSNHRYWFNIVRTPQAGYTMYDHLRDSKRWGPQFLDWMAKNWPAVQFGR